MWILIYPLIFIGVPFILGALSRMLWTFFMWGWTIGDRN